jgi:hypothetical protein
LLTINHLQAFHVSSFAHCVAVLFLSRASSIEKLSRGAELEIDGGREPTRPVSVVAGDFPRSGEARVKYQPAGGGGSDMTLMKVSPQYGEEDGGLMEGS